MALTRGILVIVCLVIGGCETMNGALQGMNEAAQADQQRRQEEQRMQRYMQSQQYFYRSGNMVCDSLTGYCQRVQ